MTKRKRVLLAGLFHETHTFLEQRTTLADFELRRGDELLAARGDGSPLAGALELAAAANWEVLPAIDLRATPSGMVEDEVVDRFWAELSAVATREIKNGLDGIYLVLHGAMVSQSLLDVEGEMLARLRNLPGFSHLPIFGVLDLHANTTARMAEHGDGFVAYRENPHTDAYQAAHDAARLLDRTMHTGTRPVTIWEQPPLVWPPTGTGTQRGPLETLEAMAREIEREYPEILAVNVFGGFSFADTPDTGVSFTAVTAGDSTIARRELQRLSQWAVEHRELGNIVDPPIEAIMPRLRDHPQGPIVIVEPADNVGGGAPGDGTAVLRALVAHGIENSAVVINDPQAVAALRTRAIGETCTLAIGGRGSRLDPGPYTLEIELVSLSNGQFELENRHSHLASMCGVHIDMGPSAVVRHSFAGNSVPGVSGQRSAVSEPANHGVRILLTSRKTPPFDLGQLRSQGIVPEHLFAIGVKAAVAHRAAYDPISRASYTVDTPGPCSSNLRSFPYRHLRRPIFPLDPLKPMTNSQ